MNNMRVTKEKATRFQETQEFEDIVNTISDRCGVPFRICITPNAVICQGDSRSKDQQKLTYIYFHELGYNDLRVSVTKDNATYNEVQLVALSIHDYLQQEKEKYNYSYTYPVAEGIVAGLPSKDKSEWSLTFRKETQKGEKSWVTYAVLGFFLNGWGVHNFYAGQTKKGLIKVLITCTIIGAPFSGLWGLYEAYCAYRDKKIPD